MRGNDLKGNEKANVCIQNVEQINILNRMRNVAVMTTRLPRLIHCEEECYASEHSVSYLLLLIIVFIQLLN